ncbi:MAG: SWIM zinc finger family protein [Nocardioidaceae bacterium]
MSDQHRRTFPPFEPRKGSRLRASTWWGQAWVAAMEQTSLDSGRLSRGRTYANGGRVGAVEVTPGRITAPVHGSRARPYRSSVYIRPLDDDAWEAFLDEVASRAGHLAALLDKDMPHDLVDAAAAAGVPLLPQVGDLDPECSCPDWGYPCKHAAALCNQLAWLLDEDPFVLLLMRGRGEDELLDELSRRNAAAGAAHIAVGPEAPGPTQGHSSASPPGTPARQAYADIPGPLPEPPDVPEPLAAGGSPVATFDPVPDGPDPEALELLVHDAATRARDVLLGRDDPADGLDESQDTIRLGATHKLPSWRLAGGTSARAVEQALHAWTYGGVVGLEVLKQTWRPSRHEIARASAALTAMWEGDEPPAVSRRANRWTFPALNMQLRLSQDGSWWPYRHEFGSWWPAGPAQADLATALSDLLTL